MMPGGNHTMQRNGVRDLDARTYEYFYSTVNTPAMAMKMIGAGSQYAMAFKDAAGDPLNGAKTYRLHLPPNIPVKNFWSLVVYDNQASDSWVTFHPTRPARRERCATPGPLGSVSLRYGK